MSSVVESWEGLRLAVPGGNVVAVALFLAFAAMIALEWRARGASRLLALRVLTALVAWVVAVQPRWDARRTEQTNGRLAVLVDASRSMSVGQPEARVDRVEALLDRWSEGGEDVALHQFGSTLRPMGWDESPQARDDESRLVAALDEITRDDVDPVGGVVVVSDGAIASESDASFEGVRVHTVHVGEPSIRDDSLARVEADPVTFLRQQAKVRVVVRTWGSGGLDVPITLRQGDEVVTEQRAQVPEGGEVVLELPFTPRRLGRAVYRVSIPTADDDGVPANNERPFLVRVARDRLRVLLVAGEPTWDVRFLREFLKRDPSIDLISFFILRTTADMTMASPDELALIPFPTDELFREHVGSFDVLLFQNFDYGPYQMAAYLPRIREYVRRGGAFAMIGGERSFAGGGYASTPIEEVLPVRLPPASTPPSQTVVTDRFQPRLDPERVHHPLLALGADPASSAARWQALPPLEGANVVHGAERDATVLLTHPTRRSVGGLLPILVLGEHEEGRVLALTVDTAWRWGLTSGGVTGDASTYERFWDRALRWLSRDPTLDPARLTTDRERYGPDADVRVQGHLRDPHYRPFAAESVRIVLRDDAGNEISSTEVVTDAEGAVEVVLRGPTDEGAYRVAALRQDSELCEQPFLVETGGDELADPRATPEPLRALADASGGRFIASPEDAPPLDELDATRTRELGVVEVAPLGNVGALALIVVLFGVEWWIRRRRGLR